MSNDNENKQNKWMDMVDMYVLGGLDEKEQERFEAYMRHNRKCRRAVKELQEVIGLLPLAVESIQPPQGMKNRILGRVFDEGGHDSPVVDDAVDQPFIAPVIPLHQPETELDVDTKQNDIPTAPVTASVSSASLEKEEQETSRPLAAASTPPVTTPRRTTTPAPRFSDVASPSRMDKSIKKRRHGERNKHTLWQIMTAVSVAAVVLIGLYSNTLRGEIGSLQQQLAMTSSEVGSLQQQITSASMPSQGLRVDDAVKLSPATKNIVAQGLATIVIDAKGTHLLVQADNLPKLQGTEAFQVWLIKGDIKQSAGTFLTRDGTGAMYYTFKPENYDTIAITLEPDDKGSQPRGPVILAANIAKQG
ncbi:anti-sigma factor domain-containing protein [Paenibacillus campi]|uniref:anti-sigma factor domain-containing protein n=1 Tax=Paenibacillus campi TaxID=3106031 RepID=UPI002AFECB04|nr:anti-sigma factor [Paenibacillus sp. SGZ-1014]